MGQYGFSADGKVQKLTQAPPRPSPAPPRVRTDKHAPRAHTSLRAARDAPSSLSRSRGAAIAPACERRSRDEVHDGGVRRRAAFVARKPNRPTGGLGVRAASPLRQSIEQVKLSSSMVESGASLVALWAAPGLLVTSHHEDMLRCALPPARPGHICARTGLAPPHRTHVASRMLRSACCVSQVACCVPLVAGCRSQVACCVSQVACCDPRVASWAGYGTSTRTRTTFCHSPRWTTGPVPPTRSARPRAAHAAVVRARAAAMGARGACGWHRTRPCCAPYNAARSQAPDG